MRWLVTGGAGFLGINLVRHLLAKGDEVVSLDRAPFEYPESGRIAEVRGDIREPGDVRRASHGCDVIVHAAAALPLYPPEEIRTIYAPQGTWTVDQIAARFPTTLGRGLTAPSPMVGAAQPAGAAT